MSVLHLERIEALYAPSTSRSGWPELTHWTAMRDRPPLCWLVPGFLPADAVAILFGDPESGKSFLSILLAVTVAAGLDWGGESVKAGSVVYVVGEGGNGIASRIEAAACALGVDPDTLSIRTRDGPLNLNCNEDVDHFIESLVGIDPPVTLIIVDTLGRCTPGGEGSAFDPALAAATFNNVERIRAASGATILLLDHPGNQEKKRPNGSFVKMAAADAVWSIEHEKDTDLRVVKAVKLKDFARDSHDALTFKLTPGRDGGAYLQPVEERLDDAAANRAEHACLTALHAVALDRGATITEWLTTATDAGISRATFYRARKRLLRGHLVDEIEKRFVLTAGGLMLVSRDGERVS